MIQWISEQEFKRNIASQFPDGRSEEVDLCGMTLPVGSTDEFVRYTPGIPNGDPTRPGPYLEWFAQSATRSFIFKKHSSNPETLVIATALYDRDALGWQFLIDLDLPERFVESLRWIKGYRNAFYSVFSKDTHGIEFEFYRAKDLDDASSMLKFLRISGFTNFLVIASAENMDLDWIAESGGQEIARYADKYTAQLFALDWSITNDAVISVRPNSGLGSDVFFHRGAMIS